MKGMRRTIVSGAAALSATGAALALPGWAVPAAAETGGWVSPQTVGPGGRVTFSTVCADGVRSAEVAGTPLGLPERIPMVPGASAGAFSVSVDLPATIRAGTYRVSIDCADGDATVVRLVVAPSGGVSTGGGGTARGADHALMAAGGGLLLVGAAGALLLRRRPS